jgi:hypothetical protein
MYCKNQSVHKKAHLNHLYLYLLIKGEAFPWFGSFTFLRPSSVVCVLLPPLVRERFVSALVSVPVPEKSSAGCTVPYVNAEPSYIYTRIDQTSRNRSILTTGGSAAHTNIEEDGSGKQGGDKSWSRAGVSVNIDRSSQ